MADKLIVPYNQLCMDDPRFRQALGVDVAMQDESSMLNGKKKFTDFIRYFLIYFFFFTIKTYL